MCGVTLLELAGAAQEGIIIIRVWRGTNDRTGQRLLLLHPGGEDSLSSLKGWSVQSFHTHFSMAVTQGESRKLNQIRGGLLSNELELQHRETFYRKRIVAELSPLW